jgi:hypothetical protein
MLTGELLALVSLRISEWHPTNRANNLQAAEAYMSLGNVSYSYVNERYFRQALIYLRRASQLPNYTLSPYLQQCVPPLLKLLRSKLQSKPRPLRFILMSKQLP